MKCARVLILGLLFCFGGTLSAADGPAPTEHDRKLPALLEELLNRARSNLVVGSAITNLPSATNSAVVQPITDPTVSIKSIPVMELTGGLKEALASGIARAVATLGRTNGFLTNTLVQIRMPSQLAKIDKTLRAAGQGAMVDEFVATMNHAAEEAVPAGLSVFSAALMNMTIGDAATLLQSNSKTAATDFFRKTTTNELSARFLPVVREATAKTGATAAYKKLTGKLPFAASLFTNTSLDIDRYVTNQALEGLFAMIADEEKRIRENPQARVTSLLGKVFGAVSSQKGN